MVLVSRLLQPCKANAGGAVTKKELCCNDQIRKDRGRENRTEGAMSERQRQGQPPFFPSGPYVFGAEYLGSLPQGRYEVRSSQAKGIWQEGPDRQAGGTQAAIERPDRQVGKEGRGDHVHILAPSFAALLVHIARCSLLAGRHLARAGSSLLLRDFLACQSVISPSIHPAALLPVCPTGRRPCLARLPRPGLPWLLPSFLPSRGHSISRVMMKKSPIWLVGTHLGVSWPLPARQRARKRSDSSSSSNSRAVTLGLGWLRFLSWSHAHARRPRPRPPITCGRPRPRPPARQMKLLAADPFASARYY